MSQAYFIYAEDDPDAVFLVRAALRKLNAEDRLVHCSDGDALICFLRDSIISGSLPTFVLLDLRMPKMGGFDALRWIRSTKALKTLPVIILSSSFLPQDIELATVLGATNYLMKPGSYGELCAQLSELLARFGLKNT